MHDDRLTAAIDHLLHASAQVQETATLAQWAAGWPALCAAESQPFARALRGGFAADRAGWAFAAGYQAALAAQLPQLDARDGALLSFSVTESTGNRPRDLRTQALPLPGGGWRLQGTKRWATLAPAATRLVVVALEGTADARPALGAFVVPAGAAGLTVRAMPPTPFAPEVPHAEVVLDGVCVAGDARLPGDAYERLVKPFRTVEDLYVGAALLAWLLREARARRWPSALVERQLLLLSAMASLAAMPPGAPATHLALAGALEMAARVHDEVDAHWRVAPDEAQARWQRDRALSGVASGPRALRAERARERLGMVPGA